MDPPNLVRTQHKAWQAGVARPFLLNFCLILWRVGRRLQVEVARQLGRCVIFGLITGYNLLIIKMLERTLSCRRMGA